VVAVTIAAVASASGQAREPQRPPASASSSVASPATAITTKKKPRRQVAKAEIASPPAPATGPRLLAFAGVDAWHAGGNLAYGGALWAPAGLDHGRFVIKTFAGAGSYRYLSGANEIAATTAIVSILPGWTFRADKFEARVYAGLDLQQHVLRPSDPTNPASGFHAGVRAGVDLWWEPFTDTMMRAYTSISSIATTHASAFAVGWRIPETLGRRFYVGPEFQVLGNDTYRQYRFGAHVTALKVGVTEWSVGGGWAQDSIARTGAHFKLGMLVRR
jgi:hypothetical protein